MNICGPEQVALCWQINPAQAHFVIPHLALQEGNIVLLILKRMEEDTPKHKVDLSPDDIVMITDGPFKELEGKVGEVDESSGKVKVLVSMFGRETPVELDFLQVKKV